MKLSQIAGILGVLTLTLSTAPLTVAAEKGEINVACYTLGLTPIQLKQGSFRGMRITSSENGKLTTYIEDIQVSYYQIEGVKKLHEKQDTIFFINAEVPVYAGETFVLATFNETGSLSGILGGDKAEDLKVTEVEEYCEKIK